MKYVASGGAGEVQIRQHQIELLLFEKGHRIRGGLCRLDFMLSLEQDGSNRLQNRIVLINE
jgi:hypothetical protein